MTKPRRGQFISKLGFQIAFLLAAVLLPLTLISMMNAKAAVDQMNARSEAALTGETINSSEGIVALIHKGRGMAAALSAIARPVLHDSAACSALMKGVTMEEPRISFAAYVPSNGLISCSSANAPIDVSSNPLFL